MSELIMGLYLAYLIGLGAAWLQFLFGSTAWRATSLCWCFCVGSIVWPYSHFLLNLFNLPCHGLWLYFWQTLLVALPFTLPRTEYMSPSDPPRKWTSKKAWWNGLVVVLLGIAVLTALCQALAFPMHLWDSIVIYGFKAKILFLEQTYKTPAFLDPEVFHYSADYPLMVPYLEAGYFRWLGHPDDRVVRLLFLAYWISWLGILYETLVDHIQQDLALLIITLVATLPHFSNMFMGQAVSGFADIPFGLYWTGFLILGMRLQRDASNASAYAMSFLALGCVFTKNEGIPAVIIGWGLFMIVASPHQRRVWISILGAVLLLCLPWEWARHPMPHNAAHYAKVLHLPCDVFMKRLILILRSFAHEIMGIDRWGLLGPITGVGLLWPQSRAPLPRECRILLTALALQALTYLYVFLTYSGDLGLLLPVTIPRLILHGMGPMVLALSLRFPKTLK
jgi:hypothetical protein